MGDILVYHLTQLDVSNLTSVTTTSLAGWRRRQQTQTHYHQLLSNELLCTDQCEPSCPPCTWTMSWVSALIMITRCNGSSPPPWHTTNWPLVSCIACHGLMTSSGSVIWRSKTPCEVNSLILRTTWHITNTLCALFTERHAGSSFTGHCVTAPWTFTLCIHITTWSPMYTQW